MIPLSQFKIALFWDVYCPRTINRALIDLLTLKRVLTSRRVNLVVTCKEEFKSFLDVLGIDHSLDFGSSDDCRIYILEGSDVPDDIYNSLPDTVDYEVVYLDRKLVAPPSLVVNDPVPYGGFQLKPQSRPIAPTMRFKYIKPKPTVEPMLAPFV